MKTRRRVKNENSNKCSFCFQALFQSIFERARKGLKESILKAPSPLLASPHIEK
jgi:hypothetical protein